MSFAIFGSSSQMWTPGTTVGIALYGPPVGRPGLGSQVSSWLAPPASQRRITRLSFFFNSLANNGLLSALRAVMSAAKVKPAAAADAPRNARREGTANL